MATRRAEISLPDGTYTQGVYSDWKVTDSGTLVLCDAQGHFSAYAPGAWSFIQDLEV